MNIDALPRGRGQAFYNIIAHDETERYVAEENIQPLGVSFPDGASARPPVGLMRVAGRYFKRWDEQTEMFVSNVREGWPDD